MRTWHLLPCPFALLAGLGATLPDAPPPTLRLAGVARPLRQAVELTLVPSQERFKRHDRDRAPARGPDEPALAERARAEAKRRATRDWRNAPHARVVPGGEDFIGFAFEKAVGPGRARLQIAYTGVVNRTETLGLFAQQNGSDWYLFAQFEPLADRRNVLDSRVSEVAVCCVHSRGSGRSWGSVST